MQTFLPSINPNIAAKILDNKRLNKQILECYQILNVLSGKSKGNAWKNHPAVLMWEDYEQGLWKYVQAMIKEAKARGIKTDKNEQNLNNLKDQCWNDWGSSQPSFWEDNEKVMRIITTHKANLYKKDPEYYYDFKDAVTDKFNKPCCDKCNYFWVTHNLK